jgi:CRP-like cAMP-binding protein
MPPLDVFQSVSATRTYAAGETVFSEGSAGGEMYLIKEGVVTICSGERTLDTLAAGDIFGEMALIGNEPRSATAVAATACCLLPVDEERFLFLVQQTPYFSLHVMGVLARRLRDRSHTGPHGQ